MADKSVTRRDAAEEPALSAALGRARLRIVASGGVRRPHLFLNPISDSTFATDVEAALGSGASTPDDLADALRGTYPDILVRRREITGEAESWYVYRDGHWVRGDDGAR
jgi:hypothetical protein